MKCHWGSASMSADTRLAPAGVGLWIVNNRGGCFNACHSATVCLAFSITGKGKVE